MYKTTKGLLQNAKMSIKYVEATIHRLRAANGRPYVLQREIFSKAQGLLQDFAAAPFGIIDFAVPARRLLPR